MDLSSRQDRPIIYVSLNYVRAFLPVEKRISLLKVLINSQRLNAFGFLNSQDLQDRAQSRGDVATNLGYLDQRLALEWVQKNIAYFGGDPKKVCPLTSVKLRCRRTEERIQVTVFGQSAGAFAIGAHLSAEKHVSRKLFRAAIMQSGATAGYVLTVRTVSAGIGCANYTVSSLVIKWTRDPTRTIPESIRAFPLGRRLWTTLSRAF